MLKQCIFLFVSLLWLSVFEVQAQELSSDAKISVLTCDPGKEVYSMYGHSAIRVYDPTNGIDVVFNYGAFSYDQPNFLYRFAKGQTDYMMLGQRFQSWLPDYEKEKRSVYEQVLNLTPESRNQLFAALVKNSRPENCVYRYNFFMDNCATRVRDMIERNSGVLVSFPSVKEKETYRQMIKQYHHSFRWIDLGIDLLVGKKAEVEVSGYGQMFLPEYLMNQFAKAQITAEGKIVPLVGETKTLMKFPNSKQESDLPWPTIVFGLFFAIISVVSVRSCLQKKQLCRLDYWLFALSGLAGIIIGWFTLFSEHPAMSPNYNLLWAFPLNFVFAGIWTVEKWRPRSRYYFWFMGALLLISVFVGQTFNVAVYFIILILLVRVVVNLLPSQQANQ
jgi:hypothetical protein